MRWLPILGVLWAFMLIEPVAMAQPLRIVSLELHPAKPPFPVLKYRLLPDVRDQQDGNAALRYYRAIVTMQQRGIRDADEPDSVFSLFEKFGDSLDTFPVDHARNMLNHHASALREVARGARRKRCEWDIPFAEDGFATLLPESQEMRILARVLAIKARVEIIDGDYAAAAETLRTGFAMSRHIAEDSVLVNSMIGVGVAKTMLVDVEHFVQANDSPNLYWALSALGSPLIDLSTSLDNERLWMHAEIPHVSKLATTTLSKAQAQELKAGLSRMMEWLGDAGTDGTLAEEMKLTAYSMLAYPKAKVALIGRGYDAETVEAMPVAQAVMLDALEHHTSFLDEAVTIARLPFYKALPLAERQERRMHDLATTRSSTLPLYSFAPSVKSMIVIGARLDRGISQLIVVEAIRNFMAEHDGRLPSSLSDITALSVPDDPITGEPFQYRLEGTTAILDAKALLGKTLTRYVISAAPLDEPAAD